MDWMDATDADVVARARDGDDEAFQALVDRHSQALFRLAWRMTGNEGDAEDVVQETFLRAYRRLDRYESRAGFGSWLHRIAANCAIDLMRSRRRHAEQLDADAPGAPDGAPPPTELLADNSPSAERLLLGAEAGRRVAAALGLLSPNERAAFVLRFHEQMPVEEIGQALGLRGNAAKQSIFRAVQKLRRALRPVAIP